MIAELALVGGLGAIAVTVADHENLFQQNPLKQWWWERPPFAPAPPAARATIPIQRPRLSPEQAWKEQVALEQKLEWQTAQRSSKYIVTDHSSPSTDFTPYRK